MVIAKAHSMQSVMHSVLTSWHVWVADVAQPNKSRMVRALKHFQYGFVSFGFSRWVVYHEDKCRWKHMLCVSRAHFNRNYWLRWLQVYKVPPMERTCSLTAAVACLTAASCAPAVVGQAPRPRAVADGSAGI